MIPRTRLKKITPDVTYYHCMGSGLTTRRECMLTGLPSDIAYDKQSVSRIYDIRRQASLRVHGVKEKKINEEISCSAQWVYCQCTRVHKDPTSKGTRALQTHEIYLEKKITNRTPFFISICLFVCFYLKLNFLFICL